jgi:predicted Zn-dependent protease with MMP-like domain
MSKVKPFLFLLAASALCGYAAGKASLNKQSEERKEQAFSRTDAPERFPSKGKKELPCKKGNAAAEASVSLPDGQDCSGAELQEETAAGQDDSSAECQKTPEEPRNASLEEFRELTSEIIDEFPDGFFDKLSGGIIVSEELVASPYAKADDLYIAGCYKENQLGKQVVLYYGSFCKLYPYASLDELKGHIRDTLRHEMRHHYECEAGDHSSKSLEAEDRRFLEDYLSRF